MQTWIMLQRRQSSEGLQETIVSEFLPFSYMLSYLRWFEPQVLLRQSPVVPLWCPHLLCFVSLRHTDFQWGPPSQKRTLSLPITTFRKMILGQRRLYITYQFGVHQFWQFWWYCIYCYVSWYCTCFTYLDILLLLLVPHLSVLILLLMILLYILKTKV